MHIIKSASVLQRYLHSLRKQTPKVTIGFVPTMGALHNGHMSLIQLSTQQNDVTVCSIFVNPTQFGEQADLEKYPKPIENDIDLLVQNECDVLFLPSYEDIYPKSYTQQVFELEGLDFKIEGASRPGHFQGVCNVLYRFFTIVEPTKAYFGQKDFQQTVVVKKLNQLMRSPLQIEIAPIQREKHGLAMSSRNVRLSEKGRQNAAFIYKAISQLKEDANEIKLKDAVAKAKQFINAQKGARIDYLLAIDTATLDEVDSLDEGQTETAVVTVVEYEGVRLLDNIIL